MPNCVHHVPGRARFKVPQLRKDPAFAAEIEQKVKDVDGVVHVEVNRHASSVTVHYDVETSPLEKVVEHIRVDGGTPVANGNGVSAMPPVANGANGHASAGANGSVSRSVGQVFGQAVFATLVQRTLERSLLSILTGIR